MTKKEADIIVKACKKYHLFAVISKVVDNYSVRLENRIEFHTFEAAKLAVNALVIEKRAKAKKENENSSTSPDTSFLKSNHHFHKSKYKNEGNWGENRSIQPDSTSDR